MIIVPPDLHNVTDEDEVNDEDNARKNKIEIFSIDELKTFFSVLMYSSYLRLLSTRNYWSNEEDLGVPLIKTAITRNRFQHLKSTVHFCNNENWEENKNDEGYKACSLFLP
uniref:PiggyBac transposable element-derived protein domain-containing protein n=1 Tax=Octopus bimaculoides TaxID=37653 RepID=A0A0L8G3V2_OCTBM